MAWESTVNYFGQTGEGIAQPLIILLQKIGALIPGIIAAVVIGLVGYFVAKGVGWLLQKGLDQLKLDSWLKVHKLEDTIGYLSLEKLFSQVVRWYIFVTFLVPAMERLELGELSMLLNTFVLWLPSLIAAVVIVVFGLIFAGFVAKRIEEAKHKHFHTVAFIVRVVLIVFFVDIGLNQMGIYVQVAENIILILVAGLVLALGLAIGIGFGGALKDDAKKYLKKWEK